ncbi:uncharacterized protein C2845_PM08G22150 [Panicum miliaceum]|uniref:Uncharacterized protein n=1 Tax=Panicum miliaceum TaxID=4540 RepID=A0A3L6R231_PANMI|nr:uncharacterized protein C2845_PM08G22150 [Panicum miliaceum]
MGNAGWRRSKDVVTEASRRAVVKPRKQRRDDDVDDELGQTTRAGRRRPRAGGVPRAGGGGGAGSVVTLKVVMRRKDAEALAARLKAQGARARRSRMAELKGELRAGGGARPAPCWDACRSRPQLAPINEK